MAVLAVTTSCLFSQGLNGTNWDRVHNPETLGWWAESSDTVNIRFRSDKGSSLPNLLELASVVPTRVVYTVSVDSPGAWITDLLTLGAHGIEVLAVEADNEYYSKTEPRLDFNQYRDRFEPLFTDLQQVLPGTKFSVFVAPRPLSINGGRKDHQRWNDSLQCFLDTSSALYCVSGHIYLNEREIPGIGDVPTVNEYDGHFDPVAEDYYLSVFTSGWQNLDHFDMSVQMLEAFGREVFVTEFGVVNTGKTSNTIGTDALSWAVWNKYRDFYIHNGQSPTNTGLVSEQTHKDVNPGDPVKRVRFYLWDMLTDYEWAEPYVAGMEVDGKAYLWYVNIGEAQALDIHAGFSRVVVRYVGGENVCSSSGVAGFWGANSTPTYVINGVGESNYLPRNSFGYIEVTPLQVKRPWWCWLFPWAKKCNNGRS